MPLTPIVLKRVKDAAIRQKGNAAFTQAMLELNTLDVVKWEDDFLGDVLHTGYQTNADAGATALAMSAPTAATPDGYATMVTGATNDEGSAMSLGLEYAADQGAVMAAIIRTSSIAAVKIEVGFTDVVADGTDTGAFAVLATPTANATDAACWVFDTDDTGNVAWQGVGVKAGTLPTKVEPTNLGNADADAAPNANISELLVVATNGAGSARFLRGDMSSDGTTDKNKRLEITYDSGWQDDFITATVAITPYVYVQTRDTNSVTLTLDYFAAWQYRYNAD